jgi:hypothetical protein
MELTSEAFKHNEQIPTRYTCDGEEERPPLEISDTPPQTRGLALIVDDLDARDGDWNFLHWIVWNIHPHTTLIKENKPLPGAVEGRTSFGTYHWGAPCPPSGTHRYRFRLFALNKELDLPKDSNAEDLEEEMNGHVLAQAELIGAYRRDGGGSWEKRA